MVSFGNNYNTMGFDYDGGSSYGDRGGYGSGQNGDGYGWSDDYSCQERGGGGFGQGYGCGNQEVSQEIELEGEEDLVAGVMETRVEEEDEVVMFQEVGLVLVALEAMEVVDREDVGGSVNQTLVIREVVSGQGV